MSSGDQPSGVPGTMLAVFLFLMFGVLGGLIWWLIPIKIVSISCFGIGAILAALSFQAGFSKIVSPFALAAVFVLLAPVAAIVRLSDPLRCKLHRTESYWMDHPPHDPTLDRMSRPY